MPNPGQELSGIAFESALGAPLVAVINAQAKAALSTVNFMKQVSLSLVAAATLILFSAAPARADEVAGLSILMAYSPQEVGKEEMPDGGRRYFVRSQTVYPPRGGSVQVPLKGFCGVIIKSPVRVSSANFDFWYKENWERYLKDFATMDQGYVQSQIELLNTKADWVAMVEGAVRTRESYAVIAKEDRWRRRVGWFAMTVRDRVHYAAYSCEDRGADDIWFSRFMENLKDAFILRAGYHNDWPPEATGAGSADKNRAQCMSHCDGPYVDAIQSCLAKCIETFER